MTSTWFVTGASRGIGRHVVETALEHGDTVAATARRPEQLDDLRSLHGDRLHVLALDVTDTARQRAVVGEVFDRLGRVDVVVSNAGYGVFGTAEDVTDADVDTMIGTNLTASVQLARAVVPRLREQGGGTLVQMSSMGGQIAFPRFGLYHAAKWGIEGFDESLRQEVEPFGIRTILVEPGQIRTGFFDAATLTPVSEPYRGGPADVAFAPPEEMAGDPVKVAVRIVEAAVSADPPFRLLLASDAWVPVTAALRDRLAAAEAQKDLAASADVDGWVAPA